MQSYLFTMQKTRGENDGKQPSVNEISEKLADAVDDLWRKASIPMMSRKRIVKMFVDYHQKYRNLMKSVSKKNTTEIFKTKLIKFQKPKILYLTLRHANALIFLNPAVKN